jgi:hypothetical protein
MVVVALQMSEEGTLDYILLSLMKICRDVVGLGTFMFKLGMRTALALRQGAWMGFWAVSPGRRRRQFMGDGERKAKAGTECRGRLAPCDMTIKVVYQMK